MDQNGNPAYPNNLGCTNGWDTSAQACVCGPGDAPMSVVGPSGVDCVEPEAATYSTGPQAVPVQSQAPPLGARSGSRGHHEQVLACDALGRCTQVIGVDPDEPSGGLPLTDTGTTDYCSGLCPNDHVLPGRSYVCSAGSDGFWNCTPLPPSGQSGASPVDVVVCYGALAGTSFGVNAIFDELAGPEIELGQAAIDTALTAIGAVGTYRCASGGQLPPPPRF